MFPSQVGSAERRRKRRTNKPSNSLILGELLMQRSILSVVLAAGMLALSAGRASACLWDRELVPHEKQFKSNYLDQQHETSYETPSAGPLVRALGSAGGLPARGAGL